MLRNFNRRIKSFIIPIFILLVYLYYNNREISSAIPSPSKPHVDILTKVSKLRIIHLDLKGAPPRMNYLIKFLNFIKKNGVEGILIEYEDMFPYKYPYEKLKNRNSYSEDELKLLFAEAKKLDLTIIPLIQTFGHLEFVLKHSEYSHLAETSYKKEICPSSEESIKLIIGMIDQIIEFHKDIKYIHIGGDEVDMKKCELCRKSPLDNVDLYIHHMAAIVRHINTITKYGLRIMIWDDMLRKFDVEKLLEFPEQVIPVVWDYTSNVNSRYENIKKYLTHFNKLMIATAFKGADGISQELPDVTQRLLNHKNWRTLIQNKRLGIHVGGFIMTGWSRYYGGAPLCELLIVSIPSLMLTLSVLENRSYNKINDFADRFYNNLIPETCDEFPGCDVGVNIIKTIKRQQNSNKALEMLKSIYYEDTVEEWAKKNNFLH